MLLNWNIQRREISWVCFWRKREYNYSPMSCGRLFQMWGPKSEKVWKLWVLRLKRWSSSMRVSDEERKGPLKTLKLAWTPMCKFIPHGSVPCLAVHKNNENNQQLLFTRTRKTINSCCSQEQGKQSTVVVHKNNENNSCSQEQWKQSTVVVHKNNENNQQSLFTRTMKTTPVVHKNNENNQQLLFTRTMKTNSPCSQEQWKQHLLFTTTMKTVVHKNKENNQQLLFTRTRKTINNCCSQEQWKQSTVVVHKNNQNNTCCSQ